jgi:hypothetical protein
MLNLDGTSVRNAALSEWSLEMKSLMVAALAVLAGGAVAVAQGCSSNDSAGAAPPNDAGEGGAIEASTDDGGADAGPGIDQPPGVYPAQHQPIPQMVNVGGPVLADPEIVTVTFAGEAQKGSIGVYTDTVIKSPYWKTVMTGFGVHAGVSGGHAELPSDFGVDAGAAVTITDDDIHALLQKHITSGLLPTPKQGKTAYALYFPKNVTIQKQSETSCQQFGGYHNNFSANVPAGDAGAAGTFDVAYAVMPRCDAYPSNDPVSNFNALTLVASHELAEMASDPYIGPNTGYVLGDDDSWLPAFYAPGTTIENGDACASYSAAAESYDESGYTVQRIWDNAAAAASENPCQPVKAGSIYFAAAVRTTKGSFNGKQTYGYIVVPKGGSTDAVINVFSKAALPHDVLLYTGKDKFGASDPSDMTKIGNNLTVTLSRQQVNNGNGVIMHIEAAANSLSGAGGDQRIAVRAVLETNDYNDWPVIIRVK